MVDGVMGKCVFITCVGARGDRDRALFLKSLCVLADTLTSVRLERANEDYDLSC